MQLRACNLCAASRVSTSRRLHHCQMRQRSGNDIYAIIRLPRCAPRQCDPDGESVRTTVQGNYTWTRSRRSARLRDSSLRDKS